MWPGCVRGGRGSAHRGLCSLHRPSRSKEALPGHSFLPSSLPPSFLGAEGDVVPAARQAGAP